MCSSDLSRPLLFHEEVGRAFHGVVRVLDHRSRLVGRRVNQIAWLLVAEPIVVRGMVAKPGSALMVPVIEHVLVRLSYMCPVLTLTGGTQRAGVFCFPSIAEKSDGANGLAGRRGQLTWVLAADESWTLCTPNGQR